MAMWLEAVLAPKAMEAVLAPKAMEAMLAEMELQAFAIVDEQPSSY